MKSILLLFFLLSCIAMQSQTTAVRLLASAWEDPAVQVLREQDAYLQGHNFNLPLLRQLQLRTESRDWDPVQQEYALRIGTNTPAMRRTQANIQATMKSLTAAERQILVQKALEARYELLIDAHFAKRNLGLLLRQQQIFQDKKAVFGQRLALGMEQDIDDYFRSEEDLLEVERRIFESQADEVEFAQRVGYFTGKMDSLLVELLPSVPFILSMAGASISVLPPSVAKEQLKADMALLEAEMERRDERNYLSYLQFKYSGNAKDVLGNRFTLGAGVNLPWPNGDKLRRQEKELEALEAKASAEMERQQAYQSALLKLGQLTKLIQRQVFAQEQKEKFAAQYDLKQLHANGLENPETLLRIEESLLKLETQLLAIEKDIYQTYISLLGETGQLAQEPARNLLSPSLDLIPR